MAAIKLSLLVRIVSSVVCLFTAPPALQANGLPYGTLEQTGIMRFGYIGYNEFLA